MNDAPRSRGLSDRGWKFILVLLAATIAANFLHDLLADPARALLTTGIAVAITAGLWLVARRL